MRFNNNSDKKLFPSKLQLALSLWLACSVLPANAADTVSIRNIALNQDKQLVIEFDNPAHINPVAPQVLDCPGEKHDIILEFSNTAFAVGQVPRAKTVLDELTKTFPSVSSIAYAASNDGTRARIKLTVSKDLSTHPALTKIDQSSAVINLDLPASQTVAGALTGAPTASSTPLIAAANAASRGRDSYPPALAPTIATTSTPVAASQPVVSTPIAATPVASTAAPSAPTIITPAITPKSELIGATTPAQPAATLTPSTPATTESPVSTASPLVAPLKTESIASPATPTTANTTAVSTPSTANSTETTASDAQHTGLATKAMHGLKDAWQSSFKWAKFPKLFGSKKTTDTPSASADEESIPSESTSTTAPATKESVINSENPTATATPTTKDVVADNTTATSVVQDAVVSPDNKPAAAPIKDVVADNTAAVSVVKDAVVNSDNKPTAPTTKDVVADNITAAPAAKDAVVNPDNKPAAPAAKDVVTNTPTVQPIADKKSLDLPRITMKPQDTSLITPLNPDEVKSLAKATEPAGDSPTAGPISTKTIVGDQSVASDLKTDFSGERTKSKLVYNEADQTQAKEPQTKADASVDAKAPVGEVKKPEPKSELKVASARSPGKDYFPPKFVTEQAQEIGYGEETLKHYNEAVKFHLAGKLPEAVTEYNAAITANPRMEESHSNLGLIYNQQNKYDLAMAEFHKALAINPKDAITYNGIGAAMRAKKNMLAAVKNWQTAISLDPNLASAHYNLGTAYEMDKDLERAMTEYKLSIKSDDKLGEAYYHMGLIYQKMNNPTLALEQFKQAIKTSSQGTYMQDAKHRVTLLSGKKEVNM